MRYPRWLLQVLSLGICLPICSPSTETFFCFLCIPYTHTTLPSLFSKVDAISWVYYKALPLLSCQFATLNCNYLFMTVESSHINVWATSDQSIVRIPGTEFLIIGEEKNEWISSRKFSLLYLCWLVPFVASIQNLKSEPTAAYRFLWDHLDPCAHVSHPIIILKLFSVLCCCNNRRISPWTYMQEIMKATMILGLLA